MAVGGRPSQALSKTEISLVSFHPLQLPYLQKRRLEVDEQSEVRALKSSAAAPMTAKVADCA